MAIRGGSIVLPAGLQTFTAGIPISQDGALSQGQGQSTIVRRGFDTGATAGFINVNGVADCTIKDMIIDGNVTTPVGLQYGVDFDKPEDAPLINNSSIWVQGGTKRLLIQNLIFQNTGGYAIFLDARTDDITDVIIENCGFMNCSPHLFGSNPGDLNYGSWTGGILVKNTGLSGSGAVINLTIQNCYWTDCTGNGIWFHSDGFDVNNKNVIITGNRFAQQGLDCIELGNVDGGTVTNNTCYQIGYVNFNPAFDPGGRCATAIDSTGWNRNCTYSHNIVQSVNGHALDLDGLHDSTISNNVLQIPVSGDPYYTTDQVASYGYSGLGNISIGINPGNTYAKEGGTNLTISGNTIKGFGYNSITVGNCKNSTITNNNIVHPAGAYSIPIIIFNTPNYDAGVLTDGNGSEGTTADKDYYRSRGNLIAGNVIEYGGSNYCIAESQVVSGQVWLSTDINQVYSNVCTGGNYGEFKKDSTSGSYAGITFSTNDATSTAPDTNRLMRDGTGSTGALKTISVVSGTAKQVSQLSDSAFLNVSENGTAGTGSIATGNRGTLAWTDAVGTSKVAADGFISIASTTYSDTDANLLSNSYMLIRRNSSTGTAEISTTTSGGSRVWVGLNATAAGSTGQLQYNGGSGVFAADSNLSWNAGAKSLTITGTSSTSSLTVANGYITSDGGLYTASTSYESIKTPSGGFLGNSLSLAGYIGMASNSALAPTTGDSWGAGTGLINFDASSGTKLFFLRYGTGTSTYADAFLNAGGVNATSTSYQSIQSVGGMLANSYSVAKYIGMASNGSLSPTSGDTWAAGTGLINYDASSGTQLFFLRYGTGTSTYADAFLHAGGVAATSTNFDSIQTSGGMHASNGYTSDQAVYLKTYASSGSLNTPGGGYGALAHKSGSTFWYYNAGWQTVDLSATGGGVTSVSGGTGVTVTGSGSLTVSIGQSVATSATPTFSTLTITSSASNAIAVTGSVSAAGFAASGTATNQIQCASGGVSAKYLVGTTSLTLTEDSSFNAGTTTSGQHRLYADSTTHRLMLGWSGGSYRQVLTTGDLSNGTGISISGNTISNSGVTSLGGFTGGLSLSAGTGVSVSGLTISIGQAVSTSSNVTFASVTTSGVHQSTATGATISFQNSSGNYQVDGNGNISGGGVCNMNGGYKVFGTAIVDSSRNATFNAITVAGQTVIDSSGNIVAKGGFFVNNGTTYTGQTGTFGPGGTTYTNLIVRGGLIVGWS